MASNKDVKVLIKIVEKHGWTVVVTNGGHYRFNAPDGSFFFASFTAGDYRNLDTVKMKLRRCGFDVRKIGK